MGVCHCCISHGSWEIVAEPCGLTWKSIDTVITLDEQQRMKGDPEFAAVVGRLHISNLGDVELLNERVIKSMRHPNRLDMSGECTTATMLVGTNFVRKSLNNSKAKSACTGELVYCTAQDTVDGVEPGLNKRKHLLGLNLADVRATLNPPSRPSV